MDKDFYSFFKKEFVLSKKIAFQCVPILGRGFETGGYKCECNQGYEYPFEDPITYIDGQLVEAEFDSMIKDR